MAWSNQEIIGNIAELPRQALDAYVVNPEWTARARSTIISQSIHHATEHRAQAVAALEARGFTSINLDEYDLWSYQIKVGE